MSKRKLLKGFLALGFLVAAGVILYWNFNEYGLTEKGDRERELRLMKQGQRLQVGAPKAPPTYTLPQEYLLPPAFSPEGKSLCTGGLDPKPFDIEGFIRELSAEGTNAKALARAKELPENAIVPIAEALERPGLTGAVHSDLSEILRTVYQHWSSLRLAEDTLAEHAWWDASGELAYRRLSTNHAVDAYVFRALEDARTNSAYAWESMSEAINAGCKDPLIRYLYLADNVGGIPPEPGRTVKDLDQAVKDLQASAYSPTRKIMANLKMLGHTIEPKSGFKPEYAREILGRAIALIPEMVKENPGRRITKKVLEEILSEATDIYWLQSQQDLEVTFEMVFPAIAKAMPNNAIAAAIEAKNWAKFAGNSLNSSNGEVTAARGAREQRADTFLSKGRAAAVRGWRLDPLNSDCAAASIDVAKYDSQDRAEMERWFSRAMAANPHDVNACKSKWWYLHPDEDEMVAFGRWCVEHGDGEDRIALVLFDIHQHLESHYSVNNDYRFRQSVWDDIRLSYEKALEDKSRAKSPDQSRRVQYVQDRGNYLFEAVRRRHWEDVLRLADEFDDEFGETGSYSISAARGLAIQAKKNATRPNQ